MNSARITMVLCAVSLIAPLLAGCALSGTSTQQTAVSAEPTSPDAKLHAEMAKMLERQGERGGAAVHYEKALEIAPHDLTAQLGYARLLVATGETEEACGWFERACQDHPESSAAHNDLGICYAECGRASDALVALRRAAVIKPDEVRYRNNLARLLIAEDQQPQALEELLAVHPPAVAHYNAGYLLQAGGKRAQAAEQFRVATSLDPSLQAAQRWSDKMARRDRLDSSTALQPRRLPQTPLQ